MRLREYFVGIPKDRKQSFIKRGRGHCPEHPIFGNKEDRKPIIANGKMSNRFSFQKKPSKDENENIYKYALSRLDGFSRYIFL